MSASHAQQLSETRQRILHLLLSEHDLVDVLLDKSVDLNAAELRKIIGSKRCQRWTVAAGEAARRCRPPKPYGPA